MLFMKVAILTLCPVEYQDVYNAVVETLLQVNSATMAMEKAEANRNKYDMMQEDYDIYRSIIPEEWAYLEEIPDEILAGYLGITNFSHEQMDFIFNIQNEYYANEQQQTQLTPNQRIQAQVNAVKHLRKQ